MIIQLILIALILIAIFKVILPTERSDLMCPDGPLQKDRTLCKEGNGKSYSGSKPNKTDSKRVLLNKIRIAASASNKDVYWRRCFLTACALCVLIFGIVMRRIPSIYELIGFLFITTMVGYMTNSFYMYHHYSHIEKHILDATKYLEKPKVKSSLK